MGDRTEYPQVTPLDQLRYEVGDLLSVLKNERPSLDNIAVYRVRNTVQELLAKGGKDPVHFLDDSLNAIGDCREYWHNARQFILVGYTRRVRKALKPILRAIEARNAAPSLEELETAMGSLCETFSQFLEDFPEADRSNSITKQPETEAKGEEPPAERPAPNKSKDFIPASSAPLGDWHKPTDRRVRAFRNRQRTRREIYGREMPFIDRDGDGDR